MASAADVVVKFLADTSQLKAGLNEAERSTTGVTRAVRGVGSAITGAFVATQVKSWITAAESAEQTSAKLAKTLKNAGDESGKWASKAEDLASSLSKQAGIDDDVIMGGQTILATFHAISGEAGQTAGIFEQATRAAVDLSATGFGSVESASTMLGKALQDPLKGLTALGKAGVTFTAEQKEQIKTLVESGDSLKAQQIILKEVEAQVGGVAEKSATGSMKMKVAFGELQESLGAALLPTFQKVASFAGMVADAFTALPAPVQTFIVTIGLAATAVGLLYSSGVNVVKGVKAIGEGVTATAKAIPEMIAKLLLLTAAQLAYTAVVALAVVAIAGFIWWMSQGKTAAEEAAEAGKRWGQAHVEAAKAAGTTTAQTIAILEPQLQLLKAAYKATQVGIHEYGETSLNASESQRRFGMTTTEVTDEMRKLGAQGAGLKAQMNELAPAIAKLKEEEKLAAITEQARVADLEKLAAASQGVATANETQRKSVNELSNAYLATAGGLVGYEAAQLQVQRAEERLIAVQADSKSSALDVAEATNSLESAKLGATQAAYNLQKTEGDLAAVLQKDGVAGLQAMKASLIETIKQHGDATGAVQGQIDKIDALIAKNPVTTKVDADTKEANDKVDEHGRKADHATRRRNTQIDVTLSPYAQEQLNRAGASLGMKTGGLIPGSRFTPSLHVLHGGERVVSAAQQMAGHYNGGTGGNISISVNVAAGTPPAEVGGAIVDAIRSYERTNGTAWRTVR